MRKVKTFWFKDYFSIPQTHWYKNLIVPIQGHVYLEFYNFLQKSSYTSSVQCKPQIHLGL